MTVTNCPTCGSRMVRTEKTIKYTYKNLTANLPQPGLFCTECDEGIFSPADLAVTRQRIQEIIPRILSN